MKTKQAISTKKQSVTVKDLKARKNLKGGGAVVLQATSAGTITAGSFRSSKIGP
jgi:hypothetical protein